MSRGSSFALLAFTLFLFATPQWLSAQDNVSYQVLEEGARFPKIQVGLEPFHMDAMFDLPDDLTGGVAAYGRLNLGKRIGFEGRYYLPLYVSGRNTFEAGGHLAFVSKEIDGEQKVVLGAFGGFSKYINVPVQVVKQNRLRYGLAVVSTDQLGSVVDEANGINVTNVPYRTRSQMFYVGLGRFFGKFARINAEGYGEKKGGLNYTIFADLLLRGAVLDGQAEVNGTKYDITRSGEYGGLGLRVGLEMQSIGGLFPFDMYTRYSWRPGFVEGNTGALEFGFGIPFLTIK